MRNNDMRAFIEEWLSRQGTDENYMVAKARAALAAPVPVAQGDPVCQAETMRDLPFATVAMQQRENERISRIVGRLESIHREQVAALAAAPSPVAEPVAWIDLLREAELIVKGKPLWKRFIDGTPLANDIAVWMADFAQEHAAPAPVAQPLTKPLRGEVIVKMASKRVDPLRASVYVPPWVIPFARDIERAHGIKATVQEGGAA